MNLYSWYLRFCSVTGFLLLCEAILCSLAGMEELRPALDLLCLAIRENDLEAHSKHFSEQLLNLTLSFLNKELHDIFIHVDGKMLCINWSSLYMYVCSSQNSRQHTHFFTFYQATNLYSMVDCKRMACPRLPALPQSRTLVSIQASSTHWMV